MDKRQLTKRVKALELTCRRGNRKALGELVAALHHSNPTVRTTAAECLGLLGIPEAVTPLIKRLNDHYREVPLRVTESLGNLLEGKDSSPALVRMLQDPDEIVRIEAVEASERIGDKNALPALRDKLIDRSPLVRGYAAVTVARLGGSDEIRTLRESFNKERHAFTRACLFGALYSLGNLAVLKNLRAISATKNPKHYDLLRHARNASHSSQRA